MNTFGKVLLALCSIGPFFLTCAVNCLMRSDYVWSGGLFLAFAGTIAISALLPMLCRKQGEKMSLVTKKIKPADKEMFAFLILYMLPLLTKADSTNFTGEIVTAALVVAIFILAICHSNTFTFNPLLGLVSGYHFYEVEDDKGMSLLLLTKKRLDRPDNSLVVVHLVDYVYLNTE